MNGRAITSLSAIATVLVVGVTYMSLGVLHLDPRRSHITVQMQLADSGGLGVGAPVLLNGVQIGRTSTVSKQATGVLVRLEIDDRYRVPVDSDIHVEQLSALGEPYLGFTPDQGTGPYLENGNVLSAERVHMPMTITALSARLVELLDQIRPEVMQSLLSTVDHALAETDSAMQTLQRSTTLLAATLLSRRGNIRQLLDDMQALGGDIDWMGPSLATAGPLFGEFGVTLDAIVQSGSMLAQARPPAQYFTGNGLVPFLTELRTLLTRIGPDLATLGPMLQPVVDDATGRIPPIDVSALVARALDTVDADGTLHFRVGLK